MKLGVFSLTGILLANAFTLLAPSAANADLLGVDFNDPPATAGVTINNTHGYEFELTQSYTLTSLGIFDQGGDGLSESHEIGLWNSDGSMLLASATVPSGTGGTFVDSADSFGGWRFTSISSLNLGPGTYVIGAYYSSTNSDSDVFNVNSANVQTLPGMTITGARSSPINLGSIAFPSTVAGNNVGYFGPNFQVQAQGVPEPSSTLLLGAVGAFGLGSRLRRRRKNQEPE